MRESPSASALVSNWVPLFADEEADDAAGQYQSPEAQAVEDRLRRVGTSDLANVSGCISQAKSAATQRPGWPGTQASHELDLKSAGTA